MQRPVTQQPDHNVPFLTHHPGTSLAVETPARLDSVLGPANIKFGLYDELIKLIPAAIEAHDFSIYSSANFSENRTIGDEIEYAMGTFKPALAKFNGGKDLSDLFTFWKNKRQGLLTRLDSSGKAAVVLKYLPPPPPPSVLFFSLILTSLC